jgi:hypothetical protein
MNLETEMLIARGNELRELRQPEEALRHYATAFVNDPDSVSAFNNYGNVMREMGRPDRAIPFLQHAVAMDPNHETAPFNLAVSYLLMGDYARGWPAYESRWNFEHLRGRLPQLDKPRWTGQDLKGKTIKVIAEQGIGDNIQFSRFLSNLHALGATVIWVVDPGMKELFPPSDVISHCVTPGELIPEFDYWICVMSIPSVLGVTLDNLPSATSYIDANANLVRQWADRLGKKTKMRVGFFWSGRRDTWINQHKSVPFDVMLDLVRRNPQYQWVNLQVDATEEETSHLMAAGVESYPGTIRNLADTAGLLYHMDVVVGIDSAVSHLAGAMGRPTWIMLNNYATDWRWLLNRNDSPWYKTVRLFRQEKRDEWRPVAVKIEKWLDLNKI